MTTAPPDRAHAPTTPPPCSAEPDRWSDPHHRTYALATCLQCPVRRWCAQEALRTAAPWGMWAGIWIEGRLGEVADRLRTITTAPPAVLEEVDSGDRARTSGSESHRAALPRTTPVHSGSVATVVLARSSGHCEVTAAGCRFSADAQMSRLPNRPVREATSAAEVFAACTACARALDSADGVADARRLGHRVDSTPLICDVPFYWRGTRWVLLGRWGQLHEVATARESARAS